MNFDTKKKMYIYWLIYSRIYSCQNKQEMQITITLPISATGHMAVDDIYNHLLPLSPLPSACTLAGHGFSLGGVTQIFIPEGSEPLAVLLVLYCCFLLILITGPKRSKRHPDISYALQKYFLLPFV